jgi:hypothetical protein
MPLGVHPITVMKRVEKRNGRQYGAIKES